MSDQWKNEIANFIPVLVRYFVILYSQLTVQLQAMVF